MRSVRLRQRKSRGETALNMAPLLDMIFILLIFFMVTTSFVTDTGIRVHLPGAVSAMPQKNVRLVVAVTEDDRIVVEGEAVDLSGLSARAARFGVAHPGGAVLVAADRHSAAGLVVSVLDTCRAAGVTRLSLAARRVD